MVKSMATRHGTFIWSDLSTFHLTKTKKFYSHVFDWNYTCHGDDYFIADKNGTHISGLYEMPQQFQEIGMPSFWMSYIQVDNVDKTVVQAKDLGAIIELVEDNAVGKIALIRDPLGAGFTVYEGNQLNARAQTRADHFVWNELYVSDVSQIKVFYETLFGWSIRPVDNDRYDVFLDDKEPIATIQQVSDEIRSKYQYWGVFFGVRDVPATQERIVKNGGKLLYEDCYMSSLADPDGAFFQIITVETKNTKLKLPSSSSFLKWKVLLGLFMILLSVYSVIAFGT